MAGLYIHLPFCKQACYYCNFHFSTSRRQQPAMVAAMIRELQWRAGYLDSRKLDSVYLGGGTPSLMSPEEMAQLFAAIDRLFDLSPGAEITLEANPDDLTPETLQALSDTPINRLSIGIQSFSEEDLQYMHRAHNAQQARQCIEDALAAGFEDLTIDLIYGSPTTSDAQWARNLDIALGYQLPHLSCYALTIEPRTALEYRVRQGKAAAVDEEQAGRQLLYLMHTAAAAGYEHYEISNFAQPGKHARHNSSYWLGAHYLGIGPSAHSYNGYSRQWNVANNARYLQLLEAPNLFESTPDSSEGSLFEKEMLSAADRYNEYVLTRLRTHWGCQLADITAFHPSFAHHFSTLIQPWLANGSVLMAADQTFTLSQAGKLIADAIAADLFWADSGRQEQE